MKASAQNWRGKASTATTAISGAGRAFACRIEAVSLISA
jgi:hypothetical protein